MNKSLILNRLKEVKKFSTDTELAKYLEISRSTLSNWYSRNSIDYDLLFSKCEKEIDINWLLTGQEFPTSHKMDNIVAKPIESNRKTKDGIFEIQRVPLFNLEATMGLVPLVNGNSIDEEKIIDYISIPNMPSCDGAIYASGDSMYPLLKSGDMIAYKRIAVERSQIFFGEMYIVAIKLDESSTMKTIKFVHQSDLGDDYIRLVSHNQHHTAKDVKLSQIAGIGLVRASIRLHN